jgi:hypothetical protein
MEVTNTCLRPKRKPLQILTQTQSRQTRSTPNPTIQIATKTSNDSCYDNEVIRREQIMMSVCHAWERDWMNGDEYTPPWIRTPDELKVTRRQRLRSYPIEIFPVQQSIIKEDMSEQLNFSGEMCVDRISNEEIVGS